jgi:hypothetical protein
LSTLQLEVYSDEPWLSIHLDREGKCVLSEWKGFSNSIEFRAGNLKVLEAIRHTTAASLFIDNRRLEGVTPTDQLWIRDTYIPLVAAAGLRRIALVQANHGLAKIATEEMLSEAKIATEEILSRAGKVTVITRTFDSVGEALKWAVAD